MNSKQFQKAVKAVYPTRNIQFKHSEVENLAFLENSSYLVQNMVHADSVYLINEETRTRTRADAIEQAGKDEL